MAWRRHDVDRFGMLTLELLGGFALRREDGAIVGVPRKVMGMLALLALSAPRAIPRDRLAGLLWEESSESQARVSLRAALSALRRAVPPAGGLRVEGPALALDEGVVSTDLAAFERLAAGGADARLEALSLFQGELLAGFPSIGSGFSAWLAGERARVGAAAAALLEAEARRAIAGRRADLALPLALRLVAFEPLHEPGHRLVMQALGDLGRVGEALRHYRQVQGLVREELGVAPEPDTVALSQELQRRRRDGAPGGAIGDPAHVPVEEEPALMAAAEAPVARRELRRLAILSLGLAGFDAASAELPPEALLRLSADWHALLDAVVREAGGRVQDRMADTAVALFGEERARLDDPMRAAAAALAILERAGALGQPARAGLAAGAVLLAEGPHDMAVLGETVTRAHALKNMAGPGCLLATAALGPELGRRLAVAPAGDGAIRVDRRGAGAAAGPAPLSGRDRELAQLSALVSATRHGAGLAILVRGEPGIGKSRLVEAASQRAADAGFRVVRAELTDFGDLAQLSPRRQLARALVGEVDTQGLPAHPLAGAIGREHLPALYQICGIQPPEAIERLLAAGTGTVDREGAFAALLAVAAEDRPLLLLVEDVHWAGPEGLRQLAHLSRAIMGLPAGLLMTVRSEEDPLDHGWRQDAGPLVTLDLPPLDPEALMLVAAAAGARSRDEARLCAARAGGNPLFVQQVAAAVATGADPAAVIPGSLSGLVQVRLDRMTQAGRALVAATAILGPECTLAMATALAGVPEAMVAASVADGGILVAERGRLRFVHALVRDAVLEGMLQSDRVALNRRAADLYRETDLARAAAHLEKAGDAGAAAGYVAAARAALAAHRADKALDLAQRGERLATSDADRADAGLMAAAALLRLRRADEARDAALAAADIAPAAEARVLALIAAADAEGAALRADAALALLGRARAEAEPLRLAGPLARLFALEGTIHFPRGRLDACLEANRQSLRWAKAATSPQAEAGARTGLAWAHYQMGAFAAAAAEAGEALALGDTAAFDRIRLSAFRVRAVSRIFLLEHDGALADAGEAIALAQAQGDTLNEVLARTTAANVHLECWRHDEAIAVAGPALALAQAHGAIGIEAAPLWALGTAAGALGRPEESVSQLRRARAAASRSGAIRFALPRILGTLAFFTHAGERRALVDEGSALLDRMAVAHSGLGLWGSALLAALAHREPWLVESCAAGIGRFAGPEPEPWAAAMLALANGHGGLVRGLDGRAQDALAFHASARATPALSWLRPVMRLAEEAAGIRAKRV